ncbi:hypothetical protein RvVAT039_pl12810 (plasmid) [Agrobacterium vitis]|uniref:DUF6118 family protein n=1 Tax=Agrobacterium vitis TaxID=373 RepID=UPI0015D9C079|nr:DUF6118 family protein [Agrobacterium vitis]BCH68448.1 hypothetical protein RvVAT039_pl12810 [Agrobacterium vitis]
MTDSSDYPEQQEPAEIDEAAQAFEALRRTLEKLARDVGGEMVVIRKGVEAAFDRQEKFQQPADYSEDLGQIVQNQIVLAEHLAAIEKSPALKNGPDHYARVLENVAERISANVSRMIESRSRDLDRVSSNLDGYVNGARDRRLQDRWLSGAGVGGLLLGILLTLFAPRVLPGSIDAVVASTAMNADHWNAGISLMQSGSPTGWHGLMVANNLFRDNQEALNACSEAAVRAKKDQRCTITVSAPAER